jgi:hypothetical protein
MVPVRLHLVVAFREERRSYNARDEYRETKQPDPGQTIHGFVPPQRVGRDDRRR